MFIVKTYFPSAMIFFFINFYLHFINAVNIIHACKGNIHGIRLCEKKHPLDNRKGSKVNNSLNKKLVIDLVITNQLSRYYELVIPYIKRLFNVLYMVIPLFRVSHISYGFIYIVALKGFFKNTYIQFPNEVYISKVCNLHYNN